MLPTYTDHPKEHAVSPLRPAPAERAAAYLREVEPYLCRASDALPQTFAVDGGTFTAAPYVMAPAAGGRVTPTHFTFAVDALARGARTPDYALDVEEAFMVIDGVLDVESIDPAGTVTTQRIGARDLALVPAGVRHRIVNRDAATARFAAITGAVDARPFPWDVRLTAARFDGSAA
jgi:mannose-6-phosphate isomerase-like protein (cupin superfamily)